MFLYRVVKRVFDVLFAVLFLLVFSPIFVITIIVIKIVSPGPVFYKARRVGLHGNVFTCYKFRSMCVDSGEVKLTTLQNDNRIFPFGYFIRKAKIDEMPQVFNILLGQMTIVGPRPEDVANVRNLYHGEYKRILDVKPGLTSPASLYDYTHGEQYEDEKLYETEFLPQKLALELYYVKNRGLLYDMLLILKTAFVIVMTLFGKQYFKKPKELDMIEMSIK
ncbi:MULTISPECIES: sugar transferase [Butyricimonas]|jgi:bacterial sugar transferase|nr:MULTISPECIES: sugar transferase [Butyricimonas]MBS6687862.1 sugar transferase [Sanguibacteroides justesenii]KAB1508466.1 sugar transferase [Butyricimonas faecihominis]WOF10364.1 sugar transferase [Butyricimonas faecihominis]BEI57261.1 sugar transferase [Butyricimonas faecihominis]GGJ41929.1 glycosyl transferase [Butyricimonas faecihominis]